MAAVADQNGDEGLLDAMRAWQQVLQLGPEQLGATIYLGTAPIYPGLDKSIADMQICDVLQSNWYDCLVRFYIPVGTNEVRAIEVYGESTRDPVEVILDEYREEDGRRWPGRARLQYGVEPRLLVTLDTVKAAGRAEAPAKESLKKASAEKASAEKASSKKAQPKNAPAKNAPAKDAPAKNAPAKDAPAKDEEK
jgi:hypothetical protein